MRSSLLAPFLVDLFKRHPATSTQQKAAAVAGVSIPSINTVLTGKHPGAVAVAKLELAARAAGATDAELRRLRALAAIDRGSLPLPRECQEERVLAAIAALEGAA